MEVVKKDNPRLMINTADDVYGTFIKGFRSLMYVLPHNTASPASIPTPNISELRAGESRHGSSRQGNNVF